MEPVKEIKKRESDSPVLIQIPSEKWDRIEKPRR